MKNIYLVYSCYFDYCNYWETYLCAFENESDALLYCEHLTELWDKKNPDSNPETRTDFYVKTFELLNIDEALLDKTSFIED